MEFHTSHPRWESALEKPNNLYIFNLFELSIGKPHDVVTPTSLTGKCVRDTTL